MVSRVSLANEARIEAARLITEIGREVRATRINAGTSQRAAGARMGLSHSQLGRIERGELRNLTLQQACRAARAVGLRPIVRLIPDADPALDAGQLALLGRLRRVLPSGAVLHTEVPLPLNGDRRAWDATVALDHVVAFEAETRLNNAQALERRIALKLRDGRVDVAILVAADTRWNRTFLDLHREALRTRFPLDSREILGALRLGKAPRARGILVL